MCVCLYVFVYFFCVMHVHNVKLYSSGLAPRIFFIFAPLLREEGRGGGSEGSGESL